MDSNPGGLDWQSCALTAEPLRPAVLAEKIRVQLDKLEQSLAEKEATIKLL